MKLSAALLCFLLGAVPLIAQELTKIDRTIAKEPVYQSKQPKYCLLVFGPEAKHRVWLVQDGETLYMDRNGNGDLTEPDKKVTAKKGDYTDPKAGVYSFEAGSIQEGKLLHKDLSLSVIRLEDLASSDVRLKEYLEKQPHARGYSLRLDVEMPGWKGIGLGGRVRQAAGYQDVHGVLAWGDRPATAPVIHLRGPWHLLAEHRLQMAVGRATDVVLSIGTPGVGPGTAAYIGYEGVVPEKVYPKVEIIYPPLRPGEPPLKELHELKERC